MRADEFARELAKLKAFRGEYVGTNLLERLEAAGLLRPRLRTRYPDPVARRFWQESREHHSYRVTLPVEPDGPRWNAAVDLSNALYRWRNYAAYGTSSHPLDDPEPRFREFIENPQETTFEPWLDRRVDVSNQIHTTLYDDGNVVDYYTSWQLLFAAEIADAGVHISLNLAHRGVLDAAKAALDEGRLPENPSYSYNLLPVHAARAFVQQEKSLDAIVWFREERSCALSHMTIKQGGTRFRLSEEQAASFQNATQELATAALTRFDCTGEDIIALMRFLAEYWSNWEHEGRPLIAAAYKEHLASAIALMRASEGATFSQLRDRVGQVGGWFKPVLDVIWPDWAEGEKERARLTLQAAMKQRDQIVPSADKADIDAFVQFLGANGLEAFFWRLRSFEEHDLRGNEFAIEGMRSDIQGMAVVIEHLAAALGATGQQLPMKFKQLWRPEIAKLLKRPDVKDLAENGRYQNDWAGFTAGLKKLQAEAGCEVVADLVLASRIRRGAHAPLTEDDHFELEAIFIALLRAALLTYAEVRRTGHV